MIPAYLTGVPVILTKKQQKEGCGPNCCTTKSGYCDCGDCDKCHLRYYRGISGAWHEGNKLGRERFMMDLLGERAQVRRELTRMRE
jgi:hypothetical protein